MNHEKILVLFEEVSLLKDQLESAIRSANQLSDLNADSKHVMAIIDRFNALENLTEKKMEAIHQASRLFSKKAYVSIGIAFLIATIIGLSAGYFVAQNTFKAYLHDHILKDQTRALALAQIELQKERASMANYVKAQAQGVLFYENAIVLPVAPEQIQTHEGQGVYFYGSD